MEKFNNSNITTFYIKQLLKDFNLPQCEVWKPGMLVYENCFYLYENTLLKAKNTGSFDELSRSNFITVMDDYTFGDKIDNLTKNLVVKNFNYDSYTHEYLGSYLRFLKDYKNIDLTSLYNCCSNRTLDNINISWYHNVMVKQQNDTGELVDVIVQEQKIFTNTNNNDKIYSVNILPYKEYTIFLDCTGQVELLACYYDGDDVMNLKFGDGQSINFPYSNVYMSLLNTSFNKPFIYDKMNSEHLSTSSWRDIKSSVNYLQRDNLKLLIKVPATNNSSLVVLEGNYVDNVSMHFKNNNLNIKNVVTSKPYTADGEVLDSTVFDQSREQNYISKLSLTKLQTGTHHPFSDRLLEYLFESAITPDDKIDNNIAKIQSIFRKGVQIGKFGDSNKSEIVKLNKFKLNGVWDNALRNCIYAVAKNKNLIERECDILGYVDKDIEQLIGLEDEM